MILLNKNSLEVADRFQVETMSLQLTERQSSASFTVGPAAPELAAGDWLMDDTEPGKGIVWRVRIVDTNYDRNTRTITLEHIVSTLKDMIMFGETTPKKMGGSSSCTARQAVEYILSKSPHWELGLFSYDSVSNPYSFNGDDLFSALQTVSSSLDDPWWDYDLTSYPFKLNIRQRSEVVTNEMRMSRNINTARMTIDKSRMYTRIYPIGKNNMHISGDYISMNEDVYGVICKVQTDQSKETKSELQRWATERLKKHCEPSVTMSVSGLDLSRETGEDLDHITLGALCQVPLPGYGTTVTETITKLSWSDKIKEPDRVTVNLANNEEDIASIVNNLTATSSSTSGSGAGGRGGAKKAEEDHAWFTDTADHVSMTAEAIVGKNASGGVDWSRVADITVNGNGIYSTVTKTEQDMVTAQTKITQTENQIGQFVTAVGSDGKITAASIVASINGSSSEVVIDADHINIGSEGSRIKLSDALSVGRNTIIVKKPMVFSDGTYVFLDSSGYVRLGNTKLYEADLRGMIKSASVSGNVLTLTPMSGDPINFSKATTLEGAWNSSTRRYTATAYQNNGTKTQVAQISTVISSSIAGADIEWDDTYWGRATIKAQDETGSYVTAATNVLINGKGAYDNGKASVTHNIDIPSSQIYTTTGSPPSGSESLGTMKTRVLQAIEDGDTLVFRVDCGGTSKHYHMSF